MRIEQLIELAQNRLRHYELMIESHEKQGDVESVLRFEQLKSETEQTLAKLLSLI
jgi:hypothetical protein